jgi:hypothetical protein
MSEPSGVGVKEPRLSHQGHFDFFERGITVPILVEKGKHEESFIV